MMHKRIVLAALSLSLAAHPQASQSTESLLIGPGDVVHIQVFDTPELTQDARVTDSGTIVLVMGGVLHVADLTPETAARKVETVLRESNFLKSPRVTVSVSEYATQKVSIVGEVRAPGAYAISTPRSILDVLPLAGGLSDTADRRIWIQRRGSTEKFSYFLSNNGGEALETAVMVRPGDTVFVPKAGIAYALGDVRNPGGYTMTDNKGKLTVLELMARAGGINNTSKASEAHLIQKTDNGYKETPLNIADMQKGKVPDFDLKPDDVIWMPFSYTKNFFLNGAQLAGALASAAVYRF